MVVGANRFEDGGHKGRLKKQLGFFKSLMPRRNDAAAAKRNVAHHYLTKSVTGSVTGTGQLSSSRSVDTRSGSASSNVGLAGSLAGTAGGALAATGIGQSSGLAGSLSGSASGEKGAGLGIQAIGTDAVRSVGGSTAGMGRGQVEAVRDQVITVRGEAQGKASGAVGGALSAVRQSGGSLGASGQTSGFADGSVHASQD